MDEYFSQLFDVGAHLGFIHDTWGWLGRVHHSWGRKRPHGGLPGRSYDLVLSIKPVMTQLWHPCIKDILWLDLNRKQTATVKPRTSAELINVINILSHYKCYLQVIDMLLSVQVDATSPLFNGHDGEADVNAAMEFPFLNLGMLKNNLIVSISDLYRYI